MDTDAASRNGGLVETPDIIMDSPDTDHLDSGYGAGLLSKKRKAFGGHAGTDSVSDVLGDHSLSAKKTKLDETGKSSADRSLLPAEIWHHIFTFCPPRTLGNLLSANKLFNSYLDSASSFVVEKSPPALDRSCVKTLEPNAIWRGARRSFWPNMPGPLKEKTELDMWRLSCSSTCQICGKRDARRPLPASDPLRTGPGSDGVACIWGFRVRCCGSCLLKNTLKEMDLVLSAASTFLIPALQFVFVTSDTCVVPLSVIERGLLPPTSTLTKLFWTADVEKLREEFSSVRELGAPAAEEWQKGLVTRYSDQRADIAKWEKYSDSGGVVNMRSLLYPGYKPQNVVPGGFLNDEKTQLATPPGDPSAKPIGDRPPNGILSGTSANRIAANVVPSKPLSFSDKEKTREEIDAEWDDIQGPVRLKILKFADEAIKGDWDEGDKVTKVNAPAFAADVLLHVRKRFYMEVEKDAKEARAAGRKPIVDPFGGPFTQKLSLENMKYVFDVKVKPITSKFRNDLFLCPSCDANMKFFGFEGVIQHYAAKHTTILSVGNVVVHWRAEWPEDPPFRPNPRISKTTGQPLPLQQPLPPRPQNHRSFPPPSPHHSQNGFQKYSNPWSLTQLLPPAPAPAPPRAELELYPPYQQAETQQFPANGFPGDDMPYNGISFHTERPPLLPYGAQPYEDTAQAASQPPITSLNSLPAYRPYVESTARPQHIVPPSVGMHTQEPIAPTAPVHPSVPAPSAAHVQTQSHNSPEPAPGVFFTAKYNETLQEIRRLWTTIYHTRGLPEVVRLFVLLYHVNKFFRSKFGEQLPLSLFSEGVTERKELGSIRGVNELPCKACHLKLGCIPGYKEDRSLFTLPQLLHHFSRAHIGSRGEKSESPTPPLDWLQDMLILPQPSALSDMVKRTKDNGKGSKLLSEAVEVLHTRKDGGKQPTFDMSAARKKATALSDRQKTKSPKGPVQKAAQQDTQKKTGSPSASNGHQSSGVDKARGKENGKQQHAPAPSVAKQGRYQDKRRDTSQSASTPAVAIKHEPIEDAQAPARDIPTHDAPALTEDSRPDLLGALEMHLKGAPAQQAGHSHVPGEEFGQARGQARVIYVDENGRELVPRREFRGPVHDDEGYARFAPDERARPAYRHQQPSVDPPERHGPVARVPHGQYREQSPLPARHYADEPDYAMRHREYEDIYEHGPPQPPPAYQYQHHRPAPPPRQEYYEDYVNETGRRVSYSRPVEYDHYEAYEVLHVVDAGGDYYARRPVRREYPQTAHREQPERYYPPTAGVGGRTVPLRRDYGDVYQEPSYGVPHDPYAYDAIYGRGPGHARAGSARTVVAPPVADRRVMRDDTAYYEEYDPHHPAEGTRMVGETGTAPAQGSRQQMRYQ